MSGAHLAVTAGLPPRIIPLAAGTFIAGRSSDADIELGHVEISRQHCKFQWNGSVCTLEDLGSIRGTRVNGQRISAVTTLQPGDQSRDRSRPSWSSGSATRRKPRPRPQRPPRRPRRCWSLANPPTGSRWTA
jgi:hypothetical protein